MSRKPNMVAVAVLAVALASAPPCHAAAQGGARKAAAGAKRHAIDSNGRRAPQRPAASEPPPRTTAPPRASVGAPALEADGKVTLNFENVDLPVFVKFISKVTGRNFVFTEKVSGTVTVVSPTPVTRDEAATVFQSVLAVHGLTTVDDGIVSRIVPIKDARAAGAALGTGVGVRGGYASRLIPLRYVDARDVADTLANILSKDGSVVAYRPTNSVIVTDTAINTEHMAAIVAALDVPSRENSVEVIPLHHASAPALAKQISDILSDESKGRGGKGGSEATFKIVADERTNSLMATGSVAAIGKIKTIVKEIDTPLRAEEQRLRVYYAKHANAEDLVEVLASMISGTRGRRPPGKGAAQAEAKPASAIGTLGLAEDVSISADPATNAVIIDASAQNYKVILGLLDMLDIERPQVFVEAIIVEVSVDRSRALGLEFQGGGDIGNGVAFGRTNLANLGGLTSGVGNPFTLSGLILAAASDKTIELPDGTEIPANIALFQALASDRNVNVLSAPTLLTLDNQEAEIIVGKNVPFVSTRGVDTANVANVFTTVERKDVGIRLKLTPQVSEGNSIILKVEEEVSAIIPNALLDANEVGPTTTVRSAATTVSVADGRTAVIGGLISDTVTKAESRVPLLSKIPLLGNLFKARNDSGNKVNLIAFLTPHIIRNSTDLARVSKDSQARYKANLHETTPLLEQELEAPTEWDPRNKPPEGAEPGAAKQGDEHLSTDWPRDFEKRF